ncbi:hypothetical protein [Methylobacterium sp. WSM2598]|uniref:hypothetical protein n=1 Tax=Methylobacterium sp. WSM2598 TaxID=398261 RepID=UPI00036E411E|nr:hypothetical protein [Methylobacterium sp. WSM2598]
MTLTASQAVTAAALYMLEAPTPLWPRSANSRCIADANGRPRIQILWSGPGREAEDHALALVICRILNEAAGADMTALEHAEAARAETAHFLRRVGARAAE